MKKLILLFLPFLLLSCGPDVKVIDDLNDKSFTLVNQENQPFTFPDDFKGQYVVLGFIYTHCPDVCPIITNNLKKMQEEMGFPSDVHFAEITFDPERDTPEVLKAYKEIYKLNENFTFLTGKPEIISETMDSLRVRSQVSMSTTTEEGKELYFMNHSDKIMVLDKDSRVVLEYGGSMTPISYIIEDLNKIRL